MQEVGSGGQHRPVLPLPECRPGERPAEISGGAVACREMAEPLFLRHRFDEGGVLQGGVDDRARLNPGGDEHGWHAHAQPVERKPHLPAGLRGLRRPRGLADRRMASYTWLMRSSPPSTLEGMVLPST